MAPKNAIQSTQTQKSSDILKDDIVMLNCVACIEGSLKLSHLRILLVIMKYLQKGIKSALSSKEMPKDYNLLKVPVSEFKLDKNAGRLRQYMNEIRCLGLISEFSYPQYTRTVQILISEKFKQLLVRPREGYFTVSLDLSQAITNKYTLRIYWLICSWKKKGGFILSLDKLRTMFELGPAYNRYDNIVSKVIAPAYSELKEKGNIWFEYKLYSSEGGRYFAFKIKLYVTDEQREKRKKQVWDRCFNILLLAGAKQESIREIYSELDYEDFGPFLDKLVEVVRFVERNKGIKDVNSYINATMNSWLSDWMSRFSK